MRKQVTLGLLAVAAMMAVPTAQAAPIFYDGFDYTAGTALNSTSNWIVQGAGNFSTYFGTTDSATLTFPGVTSTGNAAMLNTVELVQNISGLSSLSSFYTTALFNKGSTAGRLSVNFRQGWNQPQVCGFAVNTTTGTVQASNGFYTGGTYVSSTGPAVGIGTTGMLLAYVDTAAHSISVWNVADPANVPTTPDVTYTYTNLSQPGAVIIAYSSDQPTGRNVIDEVTIGELPSDVGVTFAVPEPGSLGLLMGGSLLALRRRRAR